MVKNEQLLLPEQYLKKHASISMAFTSYSKILYILLIDIKLIYTNLPL